MAKVSRSRLLGAGVTLHPCAVPPAATSHAQNADAATRARRRALRTARAATLGLALAAGVAGCEAATNAWCDAFAQSRMCCERAPGRHWDAATARCEITMPPPFVGPIVAPDRPERAASAEEATA